MLSISSVNVALSSGSMIRKIEPPEAFQPDPGVTLLLGGCKSDDCGSKSEKCRNISVLISTFYEVVLQ